MPSLRFGAPCRLRRKHAGLPHVAGRASGDLAGFASIGSGTHVLCASGAP
jgi:hypothetical protein